MLAAIHAQCFPNYWDINAFNDFFSVEGTVALLADIPSPYKGEGSKRPRAGAGVVGMVVYRIQYEQADILTIAVLPGHRRKGLACALMDAALADMENKGVTAVFLDVEDGNRPAIQLYEKLGFTVQRRRRLYYRQKDGSCTDALVMTRKLPVASGQLPV